MAHEKYVTEFSDKDGVVYGVMDEEAREELSEQKSAIDGKAPVINQTASGDIVSFADGADGMPLSSCVVSIVPVQSGSGDPSPTNVRPITGHTGAQISRTGKNLINKASGKKSSRFMILGVDNYSDTVPNGSIKLEAGTYTLSLSGANSTIADSLAVYNSGNTRIGLAYNVKKLTFTVVTPGAFRVTLAIKSADFVSWDNYDVQLEKGSSDTAYEPFGSVYPISWQTAAGTVYGGTVDTVTGVLTVDRMAVDLGSLSWEYTSSAFRSTTAVTGIVAPSTQWGQPQAICERYAPSADAELSDYHFAIGPSSYSYARKIRIMDSTYSGDADAFKTAVTGTKIVCKLTTPQTYQLDPVQIKTLMGYNAIWADTGAVDLTYPADTQTYVDSAITAATDPDGNVISVTGSTPSITGESGKRYVCGTVDSISITPPSTGIIDVVFTSGTTPTVLTVPNTVRFPAWFNPLSLNPSATYEINISDGTLGAVMEWT